MDAFKLHGVPITMAEARIPMGLRKDLHIEQILEMPDVIERWTKAKGKAPDQSDVDAIFKDFVPMQVRPICAWCVFVCVAQCVECLLC